MPTGSDTLKTSSTLLLDVCQLKPVAWQEFHARYAPVISGFARRNFARPQDIDDIVQDVMLGFYSAAPRFVYDRSKGMFRGYLYRCTLNAIKKRIVANGHYEGLPQDVADDTPAASEKWDREWTYQQMRRAIEAVREDYKDNRTFRAFELYVLLDHPAAQVAEQLAMGINSVHKAKERITAALRQKTQEIEVDEG